MLRMKKAPRLTPRQFRPKPGSEQLYRKALQRLHEDLASAAGLEEVRKTGNPSVYNCLRHRALFVEEQRGDRDDERDGGRNRCIGAGSSRWRRRAGPGAAAAYVGEAQAGRGAAAAEGRTDRAGVARAGRDGADLAAWRDAFLAAGEASLRTRPADDRDAEIARLKGKVGDLTMANELLGVKIERLEGGRPLARRRWRR